MRFYRSMFLGEESLIAGLRAVMLSGPGGHADLAETVTSHARRSLFDCLIKWHVPLK
jgi:hypothetical protein